MSNRPDNKGGDPLRDLIGQQAAEWIVEEGEHPLTQARRRGLLRWLRGSSTHVGEYMRVAAVERDLGAAVRGIDTPLEELLAAAQADDEPVMLHRQAAPPAAGGRTPRQRWHWALAASLLLGTVVSATLALLPARSVAYATAPGEQKTWQLEDGTTVHLNVDSALTVRLDRHARRIELVRGQAYFEVGRDRRPFRVRVGDNVLRDIGTAFDVYRRNGADTVTLVHGKVGVWRRAAVAPAGWRSWLSRPAPMPERHLMDLAPGTSVSIAADGNIVQIDPAGAGNAVAWLRNEIAFDDRPVAQVVAEFNRYNAVHLVVEDETIAGMRVSGVFSSHDPQAFALFLAALPDARVSTAAGRITISRNQK